MKGIRKLIVIEKGLEATKSEMDMNSDSNGYVDSYMYVVDVRLCLCLYLCFCLCCVYEFWLGI